MIGIGTCFEPKPELLYGRSTIKFAGSLKMNMSASKSSPRSPRQEAPSFGRTIVF